MIFMISFEIFSNLKIFLVDRKQKIKNKMGENDVGDIVRNCVVAACFTCLVCAILGQVLIRCLERDSSRREEQRQQNMVHPI